MAGSFIVSDKDPAITGMTAKWLCDDGSGNNIADSSGNSLDLTIGAGIGWTTGYNGVGKALTCDGSTSSASTANTNFLNFAGTLDFSFSFWAYLDNSFSSNAEVLSKGATTGYQVYFGNTSSLTVRLRSGATITAVSFTGITYTKAQWYHHVLTINRTTRVVTHYLDGILDGTGSLDAAFDTLTISNSDNFFLATGGIGTFYGYLKDVRVYRTVLLTADNAVQLSNLLR
jgi:hypothetical protein